MTSAIGDRLDRALDVLESAADIVAERVDHREAPAWAEARGWTLFLEALSDDQLTQCEHDGLCRALEGLDRAPESLHALARDVAAVTAIPHVVSARAFQTLGPGIAARKQQQVHALLCAVEAMAARNGRIIDVGAGKGHFSRLASDWFGAPTIGLDRDAARIAAAHELTGTRSGATFVRCDVLVEPLSLRPGDLVVGLHACGELGDRLVLEAAATRTDVALVSCCLQKIRSQSRPFLSRLARQRRIELRRGVLGLSNLVSRAKGVERLLCETNEAHFHRLALRLLLAERGIETRHGEELRGINRRQPFAGLERIATLAFALRGLAPATGAEIERAAAEARPRWALMRRWGLPRALLARLVEVVVTLDRAVALEEAGLAAAVGILADGSVTPRNLAVFACSDAACLPRFEDAA